MHPAEAGRGEARGTFRIQQAAICRHAPIAGRLMQLCPLPPPPPASQKLLSTSHSVDSLRRCQSAAVTWAPLPAVLLPAACLPPQGPLPPRKKPTTEHAHASPGPLLQPPSLEQPAVGKLAGQDASVLGHHLVHHSGKALCRAGPPAAPQRARLLHRLLQAVAQAVAEHAHGLEDKHGNAQPVAAQEGVGTKKQIERSAGRRKVYQVGRALYKHGGASSLPLGSPHMGPGGNRWRVELRRCWASGQAARRLLSTHQRKVDVQGTLAAA